MKQQNLTEDFITNKKKSKKKARNLMTGSFNLVIFFFSFTMLFAASPSGRAVVFSPGAAVLSSVAMWNKKELE